MKKKVYIFGAGASVAAGLPIQKDLLKNIFSLKEPKNENKKLFLEEENDFSFALITQFWEFENSRRVLAKFIINTFGKSELIKKFHDIISEKETNDTFDSNSDKENWDFIYQEVKKVNISLEDLFTILDKACILKEYFGNYSDQYLNEVQDKLNNCIVYTLAYNMQEATNIKIYEEIADYFVKKRLKNGLENESFSLISLNWDTLLDHYISKACLKSNENILIDYCCYNHDLNSEISSFKIKAMGKYNIKLMKLHGSINWLICSNCGRLYSDYENNISLLERTEKIKCKYCESFKRNYVLKKIIITPTFLKNFNNLHLKNVWHNAYLDLCDANEVIFLGYSFPDADFELRYILKKAIKSNTEITVVLHKNDNLDYYKNLLKKLPNDKTKLILKGLNLPSNRYNSFFSNHKIDYYYDGIEQYIEQYLKKEYR